MNYRTFTTEELIKHAQHLQNSPDTEMSPLFVEVLNRLIQHHDSKNLIGELEEEIEGHEAEIDGLEEDIIEYRQKIEKFKLQLKDLLAVLE